MRGSTGCATLHRAARTEGIGADFGYTLRLDADRRWCCRAWTLQPESQRGQARIISAAVFQGDGSVTIDTRLSR